VGFLAPNIEKLKTRGDVDGLIEALGDQRDNVRSGALEALVDLRAVQPLIETLLSRPPASTRDSRTRNGAAEALGSTGDERAVEALTAALDDPTVARRAAQALRRIGDRRAVAPLIAALGSSDWMVSSEAAEALGELGDGRAADALAAALAGDPRFFAAAVALSRFGDARAAGPLASHLDSELPGIRLGAAEALVRLGDRRGVERIVEDLLDPSPVRHGPAIEALGRIDDLAALAALAAAIEELDVRREIVQDPAAVVAALADARAAMVAAGRRLLKAEADVLASLRAQLGSLPASSPTDSAVLGPGAGHAREQIPLICRAIDDATAALRTGRDAHGEPITLAQVGAGLNSLLDDTTGAGFSGLMLTVLSPEGVCELERLLAELGDVAARLRAA
jgi:HEAT repeat protein